MDKRGVEPFNDAVEHNQRIVGHPNKAVDLSSMPKPLRWFYFFVIGTVITGLGFMAIAYILNWV